MPRTTRRRTRLGGALALLALPSAALPASAEVTGLEGVAQDLASDLLGRPVAFEAMDAEFGEVTKLRFENVTLANAEWAGDAPLARLQELVVWVELQSLLEGPVELPRVELRHGSLSLVDRSDGRPNWASLDAEDADTEDADAGAATDGTESAPAEDSEAADAAPACPATCPGAETRAALPQIEELRIVDLEIRYEDRAAGTVRTARIDSASGSSRQDVGVRLALDGSLDGEPLEVEFSGGSATALVEGGEPYPVDLRLVFNGVTLAAEGTVADPAALQGIDVAASLAGPNLADLYPLVSAALPATPPFELQGRLTRQGTAIALADFAGRIGDSDVDGTLSYDVGGARPLLEGRFHSPRLDFDDLAPLIGGEPDPTETASPEQVEAAQDPGLLPDEPLAVERFHAADLQIELDAEEIVDAPLPLDRLQAHFDLDDGRLQVQPLELGLGGGSAAGGIAVDAREQPPAAELDVSFQDVSLKPFFQGSEFIDEMGGLFSGELRLRGAGDSLDAIADGVDGQGVVRFRDGMVSGLLVEAAGIDVIEALALAVGDDVPVAVRCGAMALDAEDGVVAIRRAFVDTTDSLLLGAGRVDLEALTLELQIEARSKDFSLLDLKAPVVVSGALEDPDVSVGDIDPLPFFDVGDQEDIDCEAGYQIIERSAQEAAEQAAKRRKSR